MGLTKVHSDWKLSDLLGKRVKLVDGSMGMIDHGSDSPSGCIFVPDGGGALRGITIDDVLDLC